MSKRKYTVISKVLKYLSLPVIVLVFLILVFSAVLRFGTSVELMNVVSNSMVPTFYKGDLILVNTDYNKITEKISPDNVVVYSLESDEGYKITHRVKEVNGDTIILRGDNNLTDDPAVKIDQIYGMVVGIFSNAGWILNAKVFYSIAISSLSIYVVSILFEYLGKNETGLKQPVIKNKETRKKNKQKQEEIVGKRFMEENNLTVEDLIKNNPYKYVKPKRAITNDNDLTTINELTSSNEEIIIDDNISNNLKDSLENENLNENNLPKKAEEISLPPIDENYSTVKNNENLNITNTIEIPDSLPSIDFGEQKQDSLMKEQILPTNTITPKRGIHHG